MSRPSPRAHHGHVNAPNLQNADDLCDELEREREAHDAALAQLEIVGEELSTTREQLAIVDEALFLARDESVALKRRLQALVIEQHRSEARLEHTLIDSPTTLFGQDLDLRYVWAYATPFGRSPEQVIGLRDDDLFSPEQALALSSMKREALRALRPFRKIVHLTIGGAVRRIDIYVKPVEDEGGAVAGICGIATDAPLDLPG